MQILPEIDEQGDGLSGWAELCCLLLIYKIDWKGECWLHETWSRAGRPHKQISHNFSGELEISRVGGLGAFYFLWIKYLEIQFNSDCNLGIVHLFVELHFAFEEDWQSRLEWLSHKWVTWAYLVQFVHHSQHTSLQRFLEPVLHNNKLGLCHPNSDIKSR